MGIFSEWQPQYAERGIATFPVRNKVPTVNSYLKIGSRASEKLAGRFLTDDSFGFACRRSKITVLDVDTADERVLAEALDRYGRTPIIIRSGSGNFQAWYRNNGERRLVRQDKASPIDILGDGYVVAPPSLGRTNRYEMIEGNLDDIAGLPNMQNVLPILEIAIHAIPKVEKGNRNNCLFEYAMRAARRCRTLEELMTAVMDHNEAVFYEPLPADEVLKIVASAWGYETGGKNRFGRGAHVVVEHGIIDDLAAAEPRAYALLSLLKRHHWSRDNFCLAKAYAAELGWALNTFREARKVLLDRGFIECIHAGGRRPNDPSIYRLKHGVNS